MQFVSAGYGRCRAVCAWLASIKRARRVTLAAALFALAPHAVAQTADNGFDQTIDDDLEAQAQSEIDTGHRDRALGLLNTLVERDPRRAGALLDAALLYCQLGERDVSLQALTRVETKYAVPPAIKKLIEYYRSNACTPQGSRPTLSASIGVGVTSNANFGPSNALVTFAPGAPLAALELAPQSLAHGDQYVESALQGSLPVAALPGTSLFAALSERQYRSQHGFDQRTAALGVAHQKTFAYGELDNQLTADLLWLGTSVYEQDLAWHAGYWSPAASWRSTLARAGFDFTVTDESYPGNSLYDSVRIDLRAALQAHIGTRTTLLLFLGPAWDMPSNGRPGGTRSGYTAWLALDYDMGRHGQFEAVLQQRTLNDAAPYDPVFFGGTTQQQTMQAASLRYSYPINHAWSAYAQVSAERIADSISLFSYTVRSGSVGLTWKY